MFVVPRLFWANGNEIRPHPGLPDHSFQYLPDCQHGHVHLGARKGPAGQTRQGQCLDGGTQRPVAVAAGMIQSELTPASVAAKMGFGGKYWKGAVSLCWGMRSDLTYIITVGVCRVSALIGVFAVRCETDTIFKTSPLSSQYHPKKQSAIGSIFLFPFEHNNFFLHPLCLCWKSLALLCLAAAQAAPLLWPAAKPFVCVTVNRWPKMSRPSLFFYVNICDWWKPGEFHVQYILIRHHPFECSSAFAPVIIPFLSFKCGKCRCF